MKQPTLLIIALILSGCGQPGVDLSSLEALSADWQERTDQLKTFDEKLESSLITADQLFNEWSLNDEEMAKLDEDARNQYATIRTDALKALAGFTPIQDDLSAFKGVWESKTVVLQSIREQAGKNSLKGDSESTLHQLSGLVSKASDKIENWQSAYIDASVQLKNKMTDLRDYAAQRRQ